MWLLDQAILDEMRAAIDQGVVTAEDQRKYKAEYEAQDGDTPRLLSIAGEKAQINVTGVLTDSPDFLAFLFGGGNTVYSDIRLAQAAAEANPQVSEIEFNISSGGGMASAEWMATMEAIYNGKKKTRARVSSLAASAAFGIASQADEIVAQNRMSRVGSIGVVATLPKRDDVVQVTSTNAPRKRPDVNTEEGRAAIVEEIDAIEAEFIDLVARGRETTASDVKQNFGQGGVLLAAEAEKRGMIDAIASGATTRKRNKSDKATAFTGQQPTGVHKMDLNELKASHPALFAEAVQVGVTQERNRVQAHLTLADASGAMDIAVEAIGSGTEANDANVTAKHLAQTMLAAKQQARANDDQDASVADRLNADSPHADDDQDKESLAVADALEAMVGTGNDEEAFF